MELELQINGVIKSVDVATNESLLSVMRHEGYFSLKRGCETGECGACTVLVDGVPRPGCVMLAAQAGGCMLTTVESLGDARKLHPIQEAFVDTGAIQCGFCTPGMVLSAYALLQTKSDPTEEEVREALSGNLCRCTGYEKPVRAVLRAAAVMRGEAVAPLSTTSASDSSTLWEPGRTAAGRTGYSSGDTSSFAPIIHRPPVRNSALPSPLPEGLNVVGKPVAGVHAVKLVTGKPVFVDDREVRDMLHARVLTSPHAHAIIRGINVDEAKAMPGVQAILTYKDIPRVPYTTAGQSWPEPGPHDRYTLDYIVRYVGDRVAVVAAETAEIAQQALDLIHVDYEVLPAILDARQAMDAQAPHIHPESESYNIYDASRNIAAHLHTEVGNVERGFSEADVIVEGEYIVPQVQQVPLENHEVITRWDADDRLVVYSPTESPHHVRRIIAPIIGIPPRRIRVVKSRTGGSFGGKQDVLLEDMCALLTIATNRPVKLVCSRAEEFQSSSSRHAQIIRLKTGLRRDGTILANQMILVANTGAYGAHALTAQSNTGTQTLSLYPCNNMRFRAEVVYTNLPPAGAFRGYGLPQGFFALESHMDEIARQMGIDAIELRRKNWIQPGEENILAREPGEGQSSYRQLIKSSGLPQCVQIVEDKLNWKEKRGNGGSGRFRRGVGLALAMHGPTTSGKDVSGATIKLNDDGSFNVLVGASDSGTGSTTIITQIAAEVLGVAVEDILVHPVDTDVTPFSTGSTYISGEATKKAAEQVRMQILDVAGRILNTAPDTLTIKDRVISAGNGQTLTMSQVALHSLYVENQQPIMAVASYTSDDLPTSFIAQGAEVEVDIETGIVRVLKAISAVDAGRVINPVLAEGQIDGGATQALGYGICEEMVYDEHGALLTTNLNDYHIYNAVDMPQLESYLVETNDPYGPFGAKSVSEISVDALTPAIANAVADAVGVRIRELPLHPERVLRTLYAQNQNGGR